MGRAVRCGLAVILAAAVQSLSAAPVAGNPQAQIELAGDALQVGIPLVALGLTFLLDEAGGEEPATGGAGFTASGRFSLDTDWMKMNGSPRHDLALALGRTELATYTLKYGIDAERPNGGGQSFPSGHTSVAFSGAEFIRKQYGWWWGAPAYLAAGYVGWSRVESHNHWIRDVVAGAAIGIFSNYDTLAFTIPFGNLTVAPSLLSGNPVADFDPPDAGARYALGLSRPVLVPGLRFELRF